MRSQTTSSSSSKPLNLTTVIDFNRNRSNESTEAVDNMKQGSSMTSNNQYSSSASSCSGMSAHSAEGRCVPISPKKMPATPPRDAGSPASFGYGATPPSSQPSSFFSNSAVPIFPSMKMMASSWRTKDEAQASVFRSPPNTMLSSRSSSGGSGINAFFSIQRCNAFDEDDIDDEEDEVFCYSDDEEDDDDDMAGMLFQC